MQLSSYSTPEKRIKYFEETISAKKKTALELYNEIEKESPNIQSLYTFNQKVDELSRVITDIIYYIEMKNLYISKKPLNMTRPTYEELANEEKEQLFIKRNATKKTLELIEKTLSDIQDKTFLLRLQNKMEMEQLRTNLQLERIKNEIRVYESEPDLNDGEISIYLSENENSICFKGIIFLYNSPVCIGNIEYRGNNNDHWLGDIGYNIDIPFRGHNYAYKALKLIREKIINRGIDKVIITTHSDNIASQRTIEKFGGRKIDSTLEHVYRYECDLSLKLEEQPTIKI